MPYLFITPTHNVVPAVLPETRGVQRSLFRYYGTNPRGRSIVGPYPNYAIVDNPSHDQIAGMKDGRDYFLGGHVYVVTDAVAAALSASGFGSSVDVVQWGELSQYWGYYGGMPWGEVS